MKRQFYPFFISTFSLYIISPLIQIEPYNGGKIKFYPYIISILISWFRFQRYHLTFFIQSIRNIKFQFSSYFDKKLSTSTFTKSSVQVFRLQCRNSCYGKTSCSFAVSNDTSVFSVSKLK